MIIYMCRFLSLLNEQDTFYERILTHDLCGLKVEIWLNFTEKQNNTQRGTL